ncbi:hypothetical protein RN001_013052 [Aquatica leii]|uniref:Peptidase S1 domain-containing protein n=1 Tax=Aquatica leii TaxID=1421715 RepID=A0AAN7SC73_9COLE|nr:hypothetical protein RN001_013052 [Aquatica leii]
MHKIIVVFYTVLKLCFSHSSDDLQNLDQSVIAGGKASRHQFPYQVSLQRSIDGSEYIHICSGAILSLTWVATTAYCVTPGDVNYRVVAGILNKDRYDVDVQVAPIEKIVIHPEYQRGISHSDLAVINLQTTLMFTKAVQPIPISSDEDTWGASMLSSWKVQTQLLKSFSFSHLYYMIIFVSTDYECEMILGNTYDFSEKVLCTEKTSDHLFCPGESGSPLVSNGYLIGLTSWGFIPCGVTIHTKISYFLDFIIKHVTDL